MCSAEKRTDCGALVLRGGSHARSGTCRNARRTQERAAQHPPPLRHDEDREAPPRTQGPEKSRRRRRVSSSPPTATTKKVIAQGCARSRQLWLSSGYPFLLHRE